MSKSQFILRATMLAAIGGAVLATACGGDDKADATKAATVSSKPSAVVGAAGQTAAVKIADFSFTPSVKVAKGGKVTWDWAGSNAPHSVVGTSDNAKALLKSDRISGGKGTYEVTFAAAGTYKYQCGVHGDSMAGEVVVE